jgi:TetR/AcrR family transcriptional regulator, transcriptional repressor for nem operon
MARPKEFDEQEALKKALDVFWCKGYADTSMQDLTAAMGISRQSLYDTYGDKRTLFLTVLDTYAQREGKRFVQPLLAEHDIRTKIRRTLETILEEAVSDTQRAGCLIVNTAVECAAHDAEIAKHVLTAAIETRGYFVDALEKAQQRGEIPMHADVQALANHFVNTVNGMRVLAKVNPDREMMMSIITVALSVLN